MKNLMLFLVLQFQLTGRVVAENAAIAPGFLPQIRQEMSDTTNTPTGMNSNSVTPTTLPPSQPTFILGPAGRALSSPSKVPGDFVTSNLNNYVISFISHYFKENGPDLASMQTNKAPSFKMIDHIFKKKGIPEEMKYLAVIESNLNSNCVSDVGAVGTWQLMSETARLMGLTVGSKQDERRNLFKATNAAGNYLNRLYGMFQDWLLVVAAYNCGPGGVLKAIKASGSTNYWDLQQYLPHESQNQVMKFLATAYIMGKFDHFFEQNVPSDAEMPSLVKDPVPTYLSAEELSNTETVSISGRFDLHDVAQSLQVNLKELIHLNPGLEKGYSPSQHNYPLRLPKDKIALFQQEKQKLMDESVKTQLDKNKKLVEIIQPSDGILPEDHAHHQHYAHRNHPHHQS
ncbi:MAG: lytic transglycosylase domain-containing protein [Chitinophagaceae bacterium]